MCPYNWTYLFLCIHPLCGERHAHRRKNIYITKSERTHRHNEPGQNTSGILTARTDERWIPQPREAQSWSKLSSNTLRIPSRTAEWCDPLCSRSGGFRSSIHDTTFGPWLQSRSREKPGPRERLLENSSSLLYITLEFYLTKRFSERSGRKSALRERTLSPSGFKEWTERKKRWIEFFLHEMHVKRNRVA